jgi:hypothetical protein
MSWWYPRLNGVGAIAGGNGTVTLRAGGLDVDIAPGHSPQWLTDSQLLVGGRGDGTVIVDPSGAVLADTGFDFTPRAGNTSGIGAGAGHWCGWSELTGLVSDGKTIDPMAAPGDVDQATGALYYLTPYQANTRQVVIGGAAVRSALATELVAGESCCCWGEWEAVRRLYGWAPEHGICDLSPLAATEYLFQGVPVRTPYGLWVVAGTHAGLIIYPWGENAGYVIEGVAQFPHARYLDGALVIVSTSDTGVLQRWVVDLSAPPHDLSTYYPTTGAPVPPVVTPEPPIDPDEADAMNPPIVTVDAWTLDQVDDGSEFRFHDSGNPDLQIAVRVWVEGGSMRASITNSKGSAATEARRAVTPCATTPPVEPPVEPPIDPPPVEPPAASRFTLKRHDGGYLCVGPDKFLTQTSGAAATFELLKQSDGRYGLTANGKYCAAESDHRVKADRDTVGDWEVWTPMAGEKVDTVAFAAWDGLFLSAHDDGTVAADQPAIGGWESFVVAKALGPALHGRLRIDGRMLRDDVDYYRPVWVDALDILTLEHGPYLDWAVATGFNGVRVFGGNTGRGNNQTPESALACLPAFLEAARSRGLRVEVSALTGTESGYDARQYIADAAAICQPFENAVLEMANEPWHPSQKDLTPEFLESCQDCIPGELISALGAAESDESSEYAGGHYITAHLDRSRDEWNMVRRVRELEALSVENGKPVFNNEPIKAGSQNNNPAIFFTMAVLNRGFEVPGVFHSDDGLAGRVPTPGGEQQTLAEAYIRGSRVITTKQRLGYFNSGWHDSPIKEFSGAVRVYSFMCDEENVAVALGIEVPGVTEGAFSITTQNGWSLGPIVDEMPNVRVYQLVR